MSMIAVKILVLAVGFACFYRHLAKAEPSPAFRHSPGIAAELNDALTTCESQLSKYRSFILQAIINFEDVCDAYLAHSGELPALLEIANRERSDNGMIKDTMWNSLLRNYQPTEQRSEVWAFFKLLMAQFNDMEFSNIIRDTVVERCRVKAQQRDEKRNSVVLGKKQRFHSWGGKRIPPAVTPSAAVGVGAGVGVGYEQRERGQF